MGLEYKYVRTLVDMGVNQVAAFADADIVIIMHGAAMSNVAFMRPYSAVIEVLPYHWRPTVFDVRLRSLPGRCSCAFSCLRGHFVYLLVLVDVYRSAC